MSGILPGYSIPYALTPDQIVQFISDNNTNPDLQNYLNTCDPPYGIIVHYQGYAPGFGDMLVWHDQSTPCSDMYHLHVIDVTGMPIVAAVQQAPYQSPDQSIIDNMIQTIKGIVATVQPTIDLTMIAVIAVAALLILRESKR